MFFNVPSLFPRRMRQSNFYQIPQNPSLINLNILIKIDLELVSA